jgi:hypothetical protein
MKIYIILLVSILCSNLSYSQDSTINYLLEGGIRCKKFTGFYWENGITAEFSSKKVLNQKISFGMNIVSSRFGSAFRSNAIPTLEVELSVIKYFRINKDFRPLLRLNFGYAHANYGSSIFNSIPSNSALVSIETGVSYSFFEKYRIIASGGYNIIAGNGLKGLGTIYPIYGQISFLFKIR